MPQLMSRLVELAKRAVAASAESELRPVHFVAALAADPELATAVQEALGVPETLRFSDAQRKLGSKAAVLPPAEGKVPLSSFVKAVYGELYSASGGRVEGVAFMRALLLSGDSEVAEVRRLNPALEALCPVPAPKEIAEIGTVLGDVLAVQNLLSSKVVGQAGAVQQIADAVFQARLGEQGDRSGAPRAVLLFLGPPGVGKTYTAQLLAESVASGDDGGFLRLDMSGFADHEGFRGLVGFEPSYSGARSGILTDFMANHPRGLVLVDEIEKAHRSVQNLFLQVLDYGGLDDKFTRTRVSFDRATMVFTTNLGRELYSSPVGASAGSGDEVGRPAVLEALSGAVNPATGQPALAPELVSRLAKGYPILFRHLTPAALEKLAALALDELAVELEKQLGLRLEPVEPAVVTLLIQKLGPDLDARRLTAGVPLLVKDALRSVLSERREELFGKTAVWSKVRTLEIRPPEGPDAALLAPLHEGGRTFLCLTSDSLRELLEERFGDLDWTFASEETLKERLRSVSPDVILFDVAVPTGDEGRDVRGRLGRLIRTARQTRPDAPVHLFSSLEGAHLPLSEFALEQLIGTGGVHGFLPGSPSQWEPGPGGTLDSVRRAALREQALRETFRKRQNAAFQWDVAIDLQDKEGSLVLRPTDIRFETVVASKDRAARLSFTGIPGERFTDVAGAREAKRRLEEVLHWLKEPDDLQALGLRLPSGILLEGPPGNGKTLLARATAGEAGLPFFAVSATDFSSKWVGESEANIRELFERAATYAPSILFIDEIDAIGAARGSSFNSVHDSMLNQLLVSMDGFSGRDRAVFFLAATNRADLLDPALKRPGRFDLIITVGDLDLDARRELLEIKTARVPLAEDVDLAAVARATMGLSGAQLSQVVQEAAILALRRARQQGGAEVARVDNELFREAITNVRYGLRQDAALPPEEEMHRTAVHEAGHAVMGELVRPGSVHQATILPRGRALGFVESLPESEFASLTAAVIRGRIRMALAGRAAEVMEFGEDNVSAGCSQDLAVATRLAALAVSRYGMSAAVGPVSIPVLAELLPDAPAQSELMQREVAAMLRAEEEAVAVSLAENREAVVAVAQLLISKESVSGRQVRDLLAGGNGPGAPVA